VRVRVALKVHAGRDKNALETFLDTCTNEKYEVAMKIALGTSSLRGNRNDDDLLLVLPSVPNNSSNIYRNCLNIYQTLTSEHYK
jgi:hypothetical protein